MKNTEKKQEKEGKESLFGQIVFYLFIAITVAIMAFNIYLRLNCICVIVDGGSMENTLMDGDVVYMNKKQSPQRGDVVVVDVSDNKTFTCDYIIKRVIATEGDSIFCKNMTIYVRYAGTEDYVALKESYTDDTNGNAPFGPFTVGKGEVFVMGDHRSVSLDSRRAGALPVESVQGVVTPWSIQLKGIFTPWHQITSIIFDNVGTLLPSDK